MKKTLSLILALLMSASCASAIFADDAAIADEEVEATAAIEEAADEEEATPYDRAIRFLNTYGIMKGMEDGLLHAEKSVERYQMALFTGRIATGWVEDDTWEDFDANDSGFADLKGTAAENVYGAMSYVSQKGIIEGYPDGSFKPEQTVTYREALTMAVRTLGYQGLEFPWGYIEKAVSLGLTDGITDVAYTETINRGVAAQIIYNAMFADNSKLALKNFNVAFGWADAVITSTVINDSEKAKYNDTKDVTPNGYVAFQLVEKDGTLGSDVYYATAESLGLEDGHADELALGTPYSILFAKDGDDNLVDIVDYEAYEATVVTNNGRTDDEGVAYDTVDNIGEFLADYTLVDKYSSKVLANSGKLANEIIVKQAGKLTKTVIDYAKTPYAFDWTTGDILVAKSDKDGYIKTEDGDYAEYVVAYHYDKEFDRYFEIKTTVNAKGEETVVGINILDEGDVAEIREAITEACKTEVTVGQRYVAAKIGGIYATLNAYAVSANDVNYATYESYNYGKIGQKGDGYWCAKCWANKKALTINGQVVASLVDCGAGDKHTDAIWWQDAYAPVVDEEGNIESAYVIYGYNTVTKELKVLKTIEAYSEDLVDADTYYATGVLRGYSISKGYVVIGENKYYFNEDFGTYDIDQDNKNYKDGAYKTTLSNELDGLFGQFVRYYLLDGKVVEIETVGNSSTNYIVVESYAGISNDGVIVVNGYSTDDLKYDRFRIASYDGWDEGDFFWYGSQIDGEFVKGNVYKITSYDEENDLYYVSAIGVVAEEGDEKYIDAIDVDVETATIAIETGYRTYTVGNSVKSTKKVTSSDKYIIIGETKATALNYMPIAVFEGKAQDGWTVTGDVLVGDKDAKTFVIVNATNVVGFNMDSWTNAGIVMVLNYTVLDKFYDGADTEDWYLNGATEYSNVVAFNFFTGKFDTVTSTTNLKPKAGNVYQTIDGVLTEAYDDVNFDEIFVAMAKTYLDWEGTLNAPKATATSDYVFEANVAIVGDYFGDDAKKAFSKNEARDIFGITANATDLVNSLKFVKIVNDKNGNVATIEAYGKDEWKADEAEYGLTSVTGYAVYAIREDGTVDVVVYVDPTSFTGSVADEDEVSVSTENAIKIDTDAGVKGNVTATKTNVLTNGEASVEYTINTVEFTFFGSACDKENHASVYDDYYYWDGEGRCDLNNWNFTVAVDQPYNTTKIYGQDITTTTYEYDEKVCDGHDTYFNATLTKQCALIKAVEAAVADANITVVEGSTTWTAFEFVNSDGYTTAIYVEFSIVDGELVAEFVATGATLNSTSLTEVVAVKNIK